MSLVKTAPGSAKYYTEYVLGGCERPGEWMGEGAKQLGLSGKVDADHLRNLFKGLHPDGATALIKLSAIRKDRAHVPAWDLTLSAPKDVSLLGGLFDEFKDKVDRCQREAVRATIDYIENQCAFTRRGAGGKHLERCKLIVACCDHLTSRNNDPQWHSHLLILNAGAHSNGFGTIVSEFLYDYQTAINAVYLAALAEAIQSELSVTILASEQKAFEPGDAFNVYGIPDKLRKLNSSRRAEILTARAEFGATTPGGTESAARATRQPKTHLLLSVLRPHWKKVAESIGINLNDLKAEIRQGPVAKEGQVQNQSGKTATNHEQEQSAAPKDNVRPFTLKPESRQQTTASASTESTEAARPKSASTASSKSAEAESTSTVSKENSQAKSTSTSSEEKAQAKSTSTGSTQSARPEAEETISPQIAASIIEAITRSAVAAKIPDPLAERLIDQTLYEFDRKHRTDKGTDLASKKADAEKAMSGVLLHCSHMAADLQHQVKADYIKHGLSGTITSREADVALVTTMSATGAIACVEAQAGVDTNLFIATLAREYKKAGLKVRAFTPSPTGASELETMAGVPVRTVGQLVYRLKTSAVSAGLHHATQILRAAMDLHTVERWKFDNKTVVCISQAQSLKSADLEKILAEAKLAKAKVVLIGSPKQIFRREPHNAYSEVAKQHGKVTLTEPAIQTEEWMKDAVKQVSQGDARGAFSQYVLAGRLHLAKNQTDATIELVKHWGKLSKDEQNKKTLIVADSARDAAVLNKLARRSRWKSGGLGLLLRQRVDGGWMRSGDRVRFRIGSKHHGFKAGDLGTIEKIGLSGMRIRLDRTKWALLARPPIRVEVPKSLYRGLTLGYAVNSADAQQMTCDRALVLPRAGENDINGLAVQLSRAREDTRIFTTTRSVGEDIEAIARSFGKRQKMSPTVTPSPKVKEPIERNPEDDIVRKPKTGQRQQNKQGMHV